MVAAESNKAWMKSATDLDGNPRVSRGTVDVGVYEYLFERTKTRNGEIQLRWSSRPYLVYAVWSCHDLATGIRQKDVEVIPEGASTS